MKNEAPFHPQADSWWAAVPRNGEPWTAAEEKRLMAIYRRGTRGRPVIWFGKPRTKPMYRAAKALGRSPVACAARAALCQKWRRRAEDGTPLGGDEREPEPDELAEVLAEMRRGSSGRKVEPGSETMVGLGPSGKGLRT